MGFLSGLFGGGAYDENKKLLNEGKSSAQAIYMQQANAGALSDADTQAALSASYKQFSDATNRQQRLQNLGLAGSPASVAQQTQANAAAMAGQIGQAGINQANVRRNALQNYVNATQAYNQQLAQNNVAESQAQSAAIGQLFNLAGDIGGSFASGGLSTLLKKS